MSQNSFGPHLPKPGYRTRWPKQALALLGRSPLALIALAGLGVLSLVMPLLISAALYWVDIPSETIRIVLLMMATPVLAGAMMFSIAIYLREDLGTALNPGHLNASFPSIMVIIFLINGGLLLLTQLLLPPSSEQVMVSGQETIGSVLFVLLGFLSQTMSSSIVAGAIYSPFLLAGVVGAGMQPKDVRHIDHTMRHRMYGLHLEIFISIVLLTALAGLLGPFGILVHAFILAWLYVAAREVIGGISKNTSREAQKQADPDAVPEAG